MKAKHLFFALFALSLSVAACEDSFENEVQPDEPRAFTVKLRTTGEVDVTYEPLTRFTPDDRDLYSVQVWHKPATTGGYVYYAYGLFDNVEDMELEVKENYKYKFEFRLIDDGKDKIYCDSILVDNNYYSGYDQPFRGRNKYNGSSEVSITKLTNEFLYAEDRYFNGDIYIKTTDGKTSHFPENIDFYYGEINDYQPTENGTTLSVYLKRMVFGFKVNIGDFFDNGKITFTLLDKTYTLTPDNKEFEKTYTHYYYGGYGYKSWYNEDDISRAIHYATLDFKWTKADETVVDWKMYSDIPYYRLKQTVFNLEYYGEDGVLGNNTFEAHYEDTELEKDYITHNFGSEQDDYNW